jgi:hypothetical protein
VIFSFDEELHEFGIWLYTNCPIQFAAAAHRRFIPSKDFDNVLEFLLKKGKGSLLNNEMIVKCKPSLN